MANNVTIIGAGNLGSSLAHALSHSAYSENHKTTLIGRDLTQQRVSAAEAKIVLITVQDNHIEAVCDHIAPVLNAGTVVAHCSGAIGTEVLASAQAKGCGTASAHPLNTFPSVEAGTALLSDPEHQSHCFVSGTPESVKPVARLFSDLGFVVSELDATKKAAYHTACVFACNYLTALVESSLLTAESAGLNRQQFWQAIQPLMLTTMNNISTQGTVNSLSGPLARGDIQTIKRHMTALADTSPALSDTLLDCYTSLGKQALTLTQAQNVLGEDVLNKLKETLE